MVLKIWNKLLLLLIQSVVAAASVSYYQKEYSGYLFTISIDYRNQSDAQNWCNQNGSRLLAITNSSIQNATVAFINDARQQNQIGDILTDGKRTIDNWKWKWINETATSPLSIEGPNEDNSSLALSYVNLYTASGGFSLHAAKPTETNYYICEFAGQTSCVNGYQNQGQCFQSFVNENVTWFEARNRCLMKGGDLATFEFITTNDGLNSLNGFWINSWKIYWIGLRRQWWTWQSIDSDVTYSQWADGQPKYYPDDNLDCLCLGSNEDWKWKLWRPNNTAQFVCIRASSSSVTDKATPSLTVSTTTSTSLSSPASNQWRSMPNAVSMQSVSASSTTHNSPQNASSEDRSSSMNEGVDKTLAIGLGVGLGGGLLVTVLIIIIILLSRKGYIREKESSSKTANGDSAIASYETLQAALREPTDGSDYQELTVAKPAVNTHR